MLIKVFIYSNKAKAFTVVADTVMIKSEETSDS